MPISIAREPIEVYLADWLASEEGRLDEATLRGYTLYARVHFKPYFKTLDRLTEIAIAEYQRERLLCVKAKTLRKELSALRGFIRWLVLHRYIPAEIPIRSPGKHVTGTPDPKGRFKAKRIELEPDEVRRILEKLPERIRGGLRPRAYFTVLYETGLRHSTLANLRVPDDYAKGARTLRIRDEIDKARFGREVPLTKAARRALDSVCPDIGLIFGDHSLRGTIRAAARKAGLAKERANAITDHDFRHARITHLLEASHNLAGTAFLVGHKNATTTNRYFAPSQRAAADALSQIEQLAGTSAAPPPRRRPRPRRRRPRDRADSARRERMNAAVKPTATPDVS